MSVEINTFSFSSTKKGLSAFAANLSLFGLIAQTENYGMIVGYVSDDLLKGYMFAFKIETKEILLLNINEQTVSNCGKMSITYSYANTEELSAEAIDDFLIKLRDNWDSFKPTNVPSLYTRVCSISYFSQVTGKGMVAASLLFRSVELENHSHILTLNGFFMISILQGGENVVIRMVGGLVVSAGIVVIDGDNLKFLKLSDDVLGSTQDLSPALVDDIINTSERLIMHGDLLTRHANMTVKWATKSIPHRLCILCDQYKYTADANTCNFCIDCYIKQHNARLNNSSASSISMAASV